MFQSLQVKHLKLQPSKPTRIAIIGGPGTGKTSFLNHLQRKNITNSQYFPEVARSILTQEPDAYKNQITFQSKIHELGIKNYNSAQNGNYSFYDRCLIDQAIYNYFRKIWGQQEIKDFFNTYKHPYDLILFLPFNPNFYKQDKQRYESLDEAKKLHEITLKISQTYNQKIGPINSFTTNSSIKQRVDSFLNLLI